MRSKEYKLKEYDKCKIFFESENIFIFNEVDFWRICPIESTLILSKNRSRDIAQWRQIACVWMVFVNDSITKAARVMGLNHSTIIHSVKKICNALDGYDNQLFDKLLYLTDNTLKGSYLTYSNMRFNQDVKENELIGLATLQTMKNTNPGLWKDWHAQQKS